jgi:inhibitor of KinA
MDILPYGEEALLVNFAARIDLHINEQVHALDATLRRAHLNGIRFSTSAYSSLLIGFDPTQISFQKLEEQIREWGTRLREYSIPGRRQWRIPVCFTLPFALDQGEILAHTGLTDWDTFIRLFTAQPLRVFMLGFLPGFPYAGTLPEALVCPRKAKPRLAVPAQAVGIAGQQAGIYPSSSPGGWQIVGRTPVPLFLPQLQPPLLFRAGDEIQFYAISTAAYEQLDSSFRRGQIDWTDFLCSENGAQGPTQS